MVKSTYYMRKYASAALGVVLLFGLIAILKAYYAVGPHTHFGLLSVILPLLGTASLPTGAIFGLLKLYAGQASMLSLLKLPSISGGLYWAQDHWSIRVGLPAVCMVGFLAHPIGLEGWGYALLWLIPIALHFIGHNDLFLTAFGCTMTVHAVGSVIWLYTMPMTAEQWWALIPIALSERILFATLMVLMYLVHRKMSSFFGQLLISWFGSKKSVVTT